MSKNLIEDKRFTFTRYWAGSGMRYQITQRNKDEGNAFHYVSVSLEELKEMIERAKEDLL